MLHLFGVQKITKGYRNLKGQRTDIYDYVSHAGEASDMPYIIVI